MSLINVFGNDDLATNGENWFYETRIRDSCGLIFDIGCRFDSIMTSSPFEVHYFDPCVEFISRLQKLPTKNSKSVYNTFGLGEKNEQIVFYDKAQSFINRDKSCPWLGSTEKSVREIKSAKDYVVENDIKEIDFVKIDTEGYEMSIINGFGDSLEKVKIIQFEYGGTFIDANVTLKQICEKLKSHGFVNFCYLSRDSLVPIIDFTDHHQYCNIVCFNSNFSEK